MDSKELLKSIETAMDRLAQETDEVKITKGFQNYINSIGKFHNYSFMNQVLIWIQKPDATMVAGYKTWQKKFGRTVKKGEKGIAILAPMPYRPKTEEVVKVLTAGEIQTDTLDASKSKELPKIRMWWKTVYVFDISQTEGKPLPEEPNWHSSVKDEDLENQLIGFAGKKGIQVVYDDYLGGADGKATAGTIVLLPKIGTRTLIHELAHHLLGHLVNFTDRHQCEVEADTVAYVVCQHFNISNTESVNYLALWKATGKEIRECLTRISRVVIEIIGAVEQTGCSEESTDLE